MGILRCARPHTWSVLNLGARTVIHEIYMNIPLGNMTLYLTKIEFPPVSCALPWVQACMAIVRTSSETGWTRHLGTLLLSGASCSSEACALRSPPVALCPAGQTPSVPRRCSSHTHATVFAASSVDCFPGQSQNEWFVSQRIYSRCARASCE